MKLKIFDNDLLKYQVSLSILDETQNDESESYCREALSITLGKILSNFYASI